jgi:hypothetical protein
LITFITLAERPCLGGRSQLPQIMSHIHVKLSRQACIDALANCCRCRYTKRRFCPLAAVCLVPKESDQSCLVHISTCLMNEISKPYRRRRHTGGMPLAEMKFQVDKIFRRCVVYYFLARRNMDGLEFAAYR